MVVMFLFFTRFSEFRGIEQLREIIEVEHRIIFAVFAEERDVVPEPHVLQMKSDETSVTSLDSFAEFGKYFYGFLRHGSIL